MIEQAQEVATRGLSDTAYVAIGGFLVTLATLAAKAWTDRQNRKYDLEDRARKEKEASDARAVLLATAKEAVRVSVATDTKLDEVHGQINGMKDELVRATAAEQRAVGEQAGRVKMIEERAARTEEEERKEDRIEGKNLLEQGKKLLVIEEPAKGT